MEVNSGVSTIIYDDNGALYFLILRRHNPWTGWEFPKQASNGESVREAVAALVSKETGIQRFQVVKKLETKRSFQYNGVQREYDVYLVQASMNVPVEIRQEEHDSYVWATEAMVRDRLTWENERAMFDEALSSLKSPG